MKEFVEHSRQGIIIGEVQKPSQTLVQCSSTLF